MSTVIGVFRDVKSAEEAVRSLRNNGFEENEISIIAKDDRGKTVKQDMEVGGEMGMGQENIADGTAWGGALGGVAGLLAGVGALAIPGLADCGCWPARRRFVGAVTGGVAGGLLDLGIPEERGRIRE